MKKILALCLAVLLTLSVLTSCGDEGVVDSSSTTGPNEPYQKTYHVEDGILKTCIGQADENGVYVVPDTITAIAEGAFSGDTRLKKVIIGANVDMIGSGAFQNCTALEKVEIAEGVTALGSYAFYNCTALNEIKLPSTIDYINQYTFYGCTSLETISLEHIRYIDDSAFWYCQALESVTLSKELTNIDNWAFAQCSNLSDINITDAKALTAIGDYAFMGCSMLMSITIPEAVETIGVLAFYECTRLTAVEIPESVKMIDFAAFNYTPWFQENKEDYLIVGDGVLIKCAVHPAYLDLSDKNIKALGGAVFWNAENEGQSAAYGYKYASALETIVLPESLTAIGNSAFAGCYNLKDVVLPSGVTTIGDNAFSVYADGATSVTNVDFSKCDALEYIGDYAFNGCMGIETIELPLSVKFVGEYAFASTAAYDNFMEAASTAVSENERYLITGDGILVAAYVADGQTAIHVPEGVKMIAGAVFCGWDTAFIPSDTAALSASGRSKYNISFHVSELTLPSTLEVIGNSAFFRMMKVSKVILPNSLKSIGVEAFAFCDALSDISGGSDVEEIRDYAFRYCTSIPAFRFSSNTKHIGASVFSGCSSLKSVQLPEGLMFPGTSLFNSECTSLTTVYMDSSARPCVYSILGDITQSVKVFYYDE